MENLLQTLKDEHKDKINGKPKLKKVLEDNCSCLDISVTNATLLFWEIYPNRVFDFSLYLDIFNNRKQ